MTTTEQEKRLVDFLLYSARIGYGLSLKGIRETVKSELDRIEKLAIETGDPLSEKKFNDENRQSLGWVYRFLKRCPELSRRMPESLGYQRTYVTEQNSEIGSQEVKSLCRLCRNEHKKEHMVDFFLCMDKMLKL